MKNDFLSKNIDLKLWLILLIVICFRSIVYLSYSDYTITYDTTSYVEYNANIFKGEIDEFRTPVYPYVIKVVSLFSNDSITNFRNITLLQEVVSIISVVVLYLTLKKIFENHQTANCFATLLYACLPAIFTYNKVILTESLSISLFVIYFCLIMRTIKELTNKKVILIGIFTILLIMLRPSFLYLIVVLAIMFLLIYIYKKENRKQAILGGITLVCVASIILGYCYLNKKQNNIFGISNVTQINQLDTIIQMEIYDTGVPEDEGIINIIEQNLDGNMKVWYRNTTDQIMGEYTPEQVDAYIKRCIKNNFSEYFNKTIQKIFNISKSYCDEIYLRKVSNNIIQSVIPFMVIFIYMFLEAIHLLVKIIKTKKIPIEQTIILITILGQLATIILGAQAEYSRLFIVALPIVIISFAENLEVLFFTVRKKFENKDGSFSKLGPNIKKLLKIKQN